MIGTVPGEDLLAPGDGSRDLEGMLIRLSSAGGEEEHLDVSRRDFRELGAQTRTRLGGQRRARVGQHCRLVLDRFDYARIAVADVHAHQLAVEVQEALAFGRPEIDALGAGHRDGIDGALRRPLEERVPLREGHDILASHGGLLLPMRTLRYSVAASLDVISLVSSETVIERASVA